MSLLNWENDEPGTITASFNGDAGYYGITKVVYLENDKFVKNFSVLYVSYNPYVNEKLGMFDKMSTAKKACENHLSKLVKK